MPGDEQEGELTEQLGNSEVGRVSKKKKKKKKMNPRRQKAHLSPAKKAAQRTEEGVHITEALITKRNLTFPGDDLSEKM